MVEVAFSLYNFLYINVLDMINLAYFDKQKLMISKLVAGNTILM